MIATFAFSPDPGAAAPAKLPATDRPSQKTSIVYDGFRVNPARVLVRWKNVADAAQGAAARLEQALRSEDAQTLGTRATRVRTELYSQLGGVGFVEFADATAWQTAIERGDASAPLHAAPAPGAAQLKARIATLSASGLFEYVEPDYMQYSMATPSDAAFGDGRLWGLRNTGQSGGVSGIDTQVLTAWDTTTGSTNVTVAVIDTGIRYTHQDLAGNMWRNPGETAGNGIDDDGNGLVDDVFGFNSINNTGDPMDDNGHGSHCAGTIGGTANDGGPLVGVAWVVRLMGLKFLSAEGGGATSNAIKCIDYAIAKGAHIISGSYGGGGFSQATSDSIERARVAGILCIFAAGNETNNNDTNPAYPASYPHNNIVSVAAIDRAGALASFSNFGATNVDLAAPGVQIFSCNFQNDTIYQTISGTSMATPHVAGVAALLKAHRPGEGYATMRERLLASTKPLPALQGKVATGGIVQTRAALDIAADGVLEVALSTDPSPLRAGDPVTLSLRVSDLSPLTGATATGTLGTTSLVFQDNGVAPDVRSGDGTYTIRTTVPSDASGTINLAVTVTAQGKTTYNNTFPLSVVARATNDNFASAATLNLASVPVRATNLNCSRETGEPAHAGNTGGRSVWWNWTAPSNGQMQITTAGSAFDTLLGVYTGTVVSALTVVASSDDASGTLQSAVEFTATSGTIYRIAVDGFAAASGDIVLNATFTGTGGSNTPPSFVRQPASTRVQQGETIRLTAEVSGTPTPTLQWSFNGANLTNGGRISGATSAELVITDATATDGGNYVLTATNSAGTVASITATVTVDVALVRPANDDFANRQALIGASAQGSGNSTGATAQTGEPAHAGITALRSVWWVWTAPQTGAVAVDTLGSSFDTVLAIYRGSTLGALTNVASNDNATGSRQSRVTFTAEAGVQYSIAVDGAGAESGAITLRLVQGDVNGAAPTITRQPVATPLLQGFRGQLSVVATGSAPLSYQWWKNGSPLDGATTPILNIAESQPSDAGNYFVIVSNPQGSATSNTVAVAITAATAPPNDNFANASPIVSGGEFIIARLTGATRESGETFHAGGLGGTMWFRWSPAATGSATINTDGSFTEANFVLDTVLAVYTGSSLANLVQVAQNDDANSSLTSEVTFTATAGVTYFIAVGGYDVDDVGIVLLEVPSAAAGGTASAPVVLNQPISVFGSIGDNAIFYVGRGGSPTPTVQWQRSTDGGSNFTNLSNGGGITGATSQVLQIASITESQNGHRFRARLTNTAGTTDSVAAMLGVLPKPANDDFASAVTIAPGIARITGMSYGATLEAGEPDHASVGEASVWWTWQAPFTGPAVFNTVGSDFDTVLAVYTGSAVGGLTSVGSNDDFGDALQSEVEFNATLGTTYRIAVSGYNGDTGSVVINAPSDLSPSITLQPLANVDVTSGGTVTISAGATGSPAPTFQWQRSTDGGNNWNNLTNDATFAGIDTPTLVITGAAAAQNGHRYRVQVTNNAGTVSSSQSTLAVTNPVVQVTNLSTRAISLGGDRVIIPGFVISGSGTKRVLIRAVGPKLLDFGISDFLPDPTLQVFQQGAGSPLATNNNWGTQEAGRPSPATVGDSVGAFALTPDVGAPTNDTLSAAIVLDLPAGAYSTIARDTQDRSGIGIVEVYDVDDPNPNGPRLVNVANRGFVGNGSQVMIPGFVVEGTGARRYLIRAVGPKLADFGLSSATLLADPRVSVMQGGTEVASNNDWVVQTVPGSGTSADVQTIAAQIGAFGLGSEPGLPTDDQKSAALIVWLQPGAYTVVASSASGGTGLAICEVYEVP